MKLILLWLLTGGLIASIPSGSQPVDTELTAMAQTFIKLLVGRDFSAAEKYFDNTMKAALPEAKLRETWVAVITEAGAFKKQLALRTEARGAYTAVIVTCEFEKQSLDIRVVFDQAKLIAGLFFTPAVPAEYTPPGYVKRDSFTEREVTVGTGEWALPGTLTLPVGQESSPVVILVHGSGPHDRDETIGPNKPFRDLAWGLASRGIAVLRYEKRTKQHVNKLATLKTLTVKEEAIDDVLTAVATLRKTDGVDAKNIFVLGHSLGGMLVPRIGEADPGIAGLVILAGTTRPLENVILEQSIYIFSADGVVSKEEEAQLESVKQFVARVKQLKPADADSSMMLFGAPAAYWLDLRDFDPAESAKQLTQPLLILQGERDYQVTLEDFRRWQNALGSKKTVTLKAYPALNHLFVEGKGKSVPAEYNSPGHVAAAVVDDIANWIKAQTFRR